MTGKGNGQEDGPCSSIRAMKVPVLKSLYFLDSRDEAKYDHHGQARRPVVNYTDRIGLFVLKILNLIF